MTVSGDSDKLMALSDLGNTPSGGSDTPDLGDLGGINTPKGGSTGAPNPLNPSFSPAMSGADLAGLSPEMISQALQFKFGQDQFEQKKLGDTRDYMIRQQQLIQGRNQLAQKKVEFESGLELDRDKLERLKANDKYKVAVDKIDQDFDERRITLSERNGLMNRLYQSSLIDLNQGTFGLSQEKFDRLKKNDIYSKRLARIAEDLADRKMTETEANGEVNRLYTQSLTAESDARTKEVGSPTAKTPAPVTWTTATKELTKRFSDLDTIGRWAVTPELQPSRFKSQEMLVEYKDDGMDPLRAVNKAEKVARDWTSSQVADYNDYMESAQRTKDKISRNERIDKVKRAFFNKHGYIPSTRN